MRRWNLGKTFGGVQAQISRHPSPPFRQLLSNVIQFRSVDLAGTGDRQQWKLPADLLIQQDRVDYSSQTA